MTMSRFAPFLAAVTVIAGLVLSGCAQRLVPPCPSVRVDAATAGFTKFKDGPGRDLTDIEYQADIVGFKGECDYDDEEVQVTFNVDFALTGGAAAKGGEAPLYYFVAIPQFFPTAEGKRVMKVNHRLPARTGARETFSESGVTVTIPLKKDQAGASFDVYVGFQLDAAQLEYNRSRSTR